jgi:hypothetical protein
VKAHCWLVLFLALKRVPHCGPQSGSISRSSCWVRFLFMRGFAFRQVLGQVRVRKRCRILDRFWVPPEQIFASHRSAFRAHFRVPFSLSSQFVAHVLVSHAPANGCEVFRWAARGANWGRKVTPFSGPENVSADSRPSLLLTRFWASKADPILGSPLDRSCPKCPGCCVCSFCPGGRTVN